MNDSILFTPMNINRLEIKNRIIMSAMHLGYAEKKEVSEKDIAFYRARAKGGAGAIVVVAAVNDVAGPADMHSVGHDKYSAGINRLSNEMHVYDAKIFIQLFHAGRNTVSSNIDGKRPLAPSVVASPIYRELPDEMTIEDINTTIDDFGMAALRSKNAGADGVEISCSAGYLLTQFLSPLTNLRNDQYGGTKENRMRFPREVIEKVRNYVGKDYPVILRISASDMMPGGYGIDFMQEFCASLEPGLIDAISVTGGWHESPVPQISAHVPEGGYALLAEAIKRVVKVPVISCNRINNGEIAEEILQKGLAEFVGVARGFLTDAAFANNIRDGKNIRQCVACNKGCIERVLRGKAVQCAFNPEVGNESLSIEKSETKKKVLVIGAGPAGIQAAKTASMRGHETILCTKEDRVGGQLSVASKPPHKSGIDEFIDTTREELKTFNIEIRLNVKVDESVIKAIKPDYVIIATGATPIIPKIEGIEEDYIYTAEDILKGDGNLLQKIRRGKTYIIGGGSVGLETAHYLAENIYTNAASIAYINKYVPKALKSNVYSPLDITVVEMQSKVGKDLGGNRWILLNDLKQQGVKIVTEAKVLSVADHEISIMGKEGKVTDTVDNIILAIGYKVNNGELIQYLETNNMAYSVIGDALKPRNIMEALRDGYLEVMPI
ncbi:FAD-dependent oxidoreductase [Fusibacter paucivorans]|uniref:FAD-dependent oxidoreductase n=1 Tax=Fusibacter paucivorans TaxID=76009 RepID=A0ABS5PU11_9FIRM|nr:NAD(P)/FAD-dependent oxidoreductase [Fusibacter paucivorans]MBS7528660.1 FAD-dependent oxidoreductase [Fusibacter paucivorans]